MDPFAQALSIDAAAMRAQSIRLRTISQNIANAQVTAANPKENPYRRQLVRFENRLDRGIDTHLVQIRDIIKDPSPFARRYEPHHPAADPNGYVRYPNVESLIELNDFRQASRSYEASMQAYKVTRQLLDSTIGLLR